MELHTQEEVIHTLELVIEKVRQASIKEAYIEINEYRLVPAYTNVKIEITWGH